MNWSLLVLPLAALLFFGGIFGTFLVAEAASNRVKGDFLQFVVGGTVSLVMLGAVAGGSAWLVIWGLS